MQPSPMKGSPAGACPLWYLPRTAGEPLPCTLRPQQSCISILCRVLTLDFSSGAPGRSRTCGLRIRSPTLYPAELRARQKHLIKAVETAD